MSQVKLADEFVYYFALFLVKKEDGADNTSTSANVASQFSEPDWRTC